MAPSANRHSGFSRKAQYSTFFAYLAAIVGALVGLGLLIVSISNAGAFADARAVANDAAAPGGNAVADARSGGQSVFASIAGYFRAGSQNARLARELAEAKTRLVEAEGIAEENERLKALLALNDSDRKPVTFTRMTASTASSTRRFATIGVGASNGVQVGMPVRSPLGLLGRVLEVGNASSLVLLVTDSQSVVPARRATDGVPAFVQGRGDGTVQIRLINLGINPLKKGDVFVTSGSGGLYRPNMAICMVTALTRDGAIARVLSDPAVTDYVAVEGVWNETAPPPLSEARQ
ncbi:MAG: rod shape-determining protein MreC [Novosphingobium sp.]|nr:rod shape-determining protein MreC [Novosphingobium sp.]